ncbi:molybdenum cofactor synthesis domain protein [Ammonifex degensii KC4]|uniref:Molybdopterin molybdenumtransferase n=1 Tax=Ammonifex degensii (strain DSM 10501 / KC4) TaxID=429009 RepID=C9RCS8_AMMDK|nr:gephyrin-like molybdotransferase Glp [Ammonifex degensii]ACX52055.1 molybdenum cofactor synthesis domain protein [Ammonifex degensii KC4]
MLFTTLTLAEAREKLRRSMRPWPVEEVGLGEALGRILAQDLAAREDVPGFDRSTVDGYAVRAADTFGASEGLPAILRLAGEVYMGSPPEKELLPGEAWRISTGGMLPEGADAVVMVEYTEELDEETVAVYRPVAPGENVVRRGDDVQAGRVILPAGRRLRPADVGLLATCGWERVPVFRKPRIGVIGTGDEIVEVGQVPGPGQVRDVNTWSLTAAVAAAGGEPVRYGVVRDRLPEIKEALSRALEECDGVCLAGGSSVGVRDLALEAIEDLPGAEVLFHGLAVRPGKPTLGAVVDGKLVVGLPGHPVSALVVFNFLFRPLLEPEKENPLLLRARLTRSLSSAPGREDFVPAEIGVEEGVMVARPILGKSGLIAWLARAQALIHLPLDAEGAAAGEWVDVFLV